MDKFKPLVLPKVEKKNWGFVTTGAHSHAGSTPLGAYQPSSSTLPGPTPRWVDITKPIMTVCKEMFDPADFRFWGCYINSYDTIQKCSCRNCGGIVMTNGLRRKHSDVLQCYDKLVRAYKFLLLDKLCVICDTRTSASKWGVPLCSEKCKRTFAFDTVRPQALSDALQITGRAQ
jgi:hypothetical protein